MGSVAAGLPLLLLLRRGHAGRRAPVVALADAAADLQAGSQRLAGVVAAQHEIAAAGTDLDGILRATVERTRLLTGADGASVALFEEDGAVVRAASGCAEAWLGTAVPPAGSLSDGAQAAEGDSASGAGESCMVVDLRHGHTVFGVLQVVAAHPGAFDELDGSVLRLVAGLVGDAVGTAAAFAGRQALVEEREAALDALEDSELRFRAAFEEAPTGVALISAGGRYVQVNRALCTLLGEAEDELLGASCSAAVHPDEVEADRLAIADLLTGGVAGHERELRFRRRDGSEVFAQVQRAVVRDLDGDPLYLVAQVSDVTERRMAALALQRQAAELARSNAELDQFASVASHDLQEPLRMVGAYTELLAKRYAGRLDPDADVFMGYALDGVDRMRRLISDLLRYARVGSRDVGSGPVDLAVVAQRAITDCALTIAEAGAKVHVHPLPVVLGNEGQYGQLLVNLIGNAVKFRGERPPAVHVEAVPAGDGWVVTVSDNGIGIPPDDAERVFAVFERLHPADRFEGTGIGLAVCRKIVERVGGRIWAEAAPGGGTAISFHLPGAAAGFGAAHPTAVSELAGVRH